MRIAKVMYLIAISSLVDAGHIADIANYARSCATVLLPGAHPRQQGALGQLLEVGSRGHGAAAGEARPEAGQSLKAFDIVNRTACGSAGWKCTSLTPSAGPPVRGKGPCMHFG